MSGKELFCPARVYGVIAGCHSCVDLRGGPSTTCLTRVKAYQKREGLQKMYENLFAPTPANHEDIHHNEISFIEPRASLLEIERKNAQSLGTEQYIYGGDYTEKT